MDWTVNVPQTLKCFHWKAEAFNAACLNLRLRPTVRLFKGPITEPVLSLTIGHYWPQGSNNHLFLAGRFCKRHWRERLCRINEWEILLDCSSLWGCGFPAAWSSRTSSASGEQEDEYMKLSHGSTTVYPVLSLLTSSRGRASLTTPLILNLKMLAIE